MAADGCSTKIPVSGQRTSSARTAKAVVTGSAQSANGSGGTTGTGRSNPTFLNALSSTLWSAFFFLIPQYLLVVD